MKTLFTAILLIALVALVPSSSFAQAVDSVVVAALPPGNLNKVINGDTLATGGGRVNPNRVYVLKQTGAVDTVYFITSQISINGNLTLVGKTNPITGKPPVIEPLINSDNSSPGNFIQALTGKTVSCKNIYFLGTRTDKASVTPQCISASGDSITFKFDHCIVEHVGETSTPNIFNTWSSSHDKIFITNCELRDNQSDVPQNPGCNWCDPGMYPVDTAIYSNNTMFVMGGCVEGSGQDAGYFKFDHNTMFMQTKSAPFTLQQMHNSVITNNIFFGVNSAGLDSAHIYNPAVRNANFYTVPAIIELDTLSTMKATPYFYTEASRKIVVTNNAYFWPAKIVANFATINSDPVYRALGTGPVTAPIWKASSIPDLLNNATLYPLINISSTTNVNVDPGFDATLVSAASDSMARFVKVCWEQGNGQNSRPFVYRTDPTKLFAGVAANWATTQNYPVQENLRYTNTTLKTAGSDGLPLGDLNWFPEYHPLGVKEMSNSLPSEFNLSQNYPNPFNPSTSIRVSLHQAGAMSLTIYNLLGQVVRVVDQGNKQAGEYVYDVNMDKLGSGVYFYTLRQGNNSISKKMLLLK